MTYDLDLFLQQLKIDPIITIQQAALLRDSARTPLNLAISHHLKRDNPKLHIKADDDVIQVMDEVEGIRITLYAHSARISIPFWFTDETLIAAAFDTARQYSHIILTHVAYRIYDPQLGRVVNIEKDLPAMIDAYKHAIRGMQSLI